MKPLHLLTNIGKGKLLADLFPEKVEPIIDNILEVCRHITQHQEAIKRTWDSGFVSFDFWLSLAAEAEKLIRKHRYNIIRSSKVFSDQLFFGHLALFTNDCIIKYAAKQGSPAKFQKTVELLFT
jgi:hypothetical protein